jgi:hypothetical protein
MKLQNKYQFKEFTKVKKIAIKNEGGWNYKKINFKNDLK